jgi:type IV pilus assembly protein PilB
VSTTFYAMLKNHDPFLNSIVTIEKQPSADIPNIAQNRYTLSDTGTTTYARKLQTLLRTGPDIMGVGEVEDAQTAALICGAATKNNNHMYIIIEAESSLAALSKWMKLVNDQNLVAETLGGISNQRLIRKLCPECKQAYEPNKELLKKFNIPADKVKTLYRAGEPQFDKKGRPVLCPKCQSTGFYGRMATFETIVINDEVRNAIKTAKSMQEIGMSFRRARMLFLQEQALKKVVDGTTAINELIREFTPAEKAAPKPAAAK